MEINENFLLSSSEPATGKRHFVGMSLPVIVESQDTCFKQVLNALMKLGTREDLISQHITTGAHPLFIH